MRKFSDHAATSFWPALFTKELEFEREFVNRGGLLLAGIDPTGYGGVVAGFSDQREVELLVEAGFAPLEAIHIAISNGAEFLRELDKIGTLAPGKAAEIVVLQGDPSANIKDIEKVGIVFLSWSAACLIRGLHASSTTLLQTGRVDATSPGRVCP
jgi:hypothetical protein